MTEGGRGGRQDGEDERSAKEKKIEANRQHYQERAGIIKGLIAALGIMVAMHGACKIQELLGSNHKPTTQIQKSKK